MKKFTFLKTAFLGAILFFLCNATAFAQCDLFEDFENLTGSAAYTGKTVTTPNGDWWIVGYSAMDNNDRRIGEKSIRLRAGNSDTLNVVTGEGTYGANVVEMKFDKPNGVGKVNFFYGSYSTHSGGIVSVEYSSDGGATWIKPENNSVTSPAWNTVEEMLEFSVIINVQGNARVRIIKYKQTGSTSVNVDNICITDFDPEGYVTAPKFDPPGGSYTNPINVTISCATEGATIRYTLDGTNPNEDSQEYTTAIPVSEQTTIKAKAWKEDMEESPTSTATYIFPQGITTLAELRTLAPDYNAGTNTGTTAYIYTGEAVVTQVQAYRNVKYIQDETAAMYIYDTEGKIQTGVEVGDKISNLSGTMTNYFGMIEFIPLDECTIVDYSQSKVPATVITASQLNNDYDNPIQAKVVTIKDVIYVQTGNFENGKYYNLKENNVEYDSVVYTDNYDTDYIGDPIPAIAVNINGVINFKGGQGIETRNRIVPLDKSNNIILNITNINPSAIALAPNPANSFVNIMVDAQMKLEVYSIIGNLIAVEYLYEGKNTISVSDYSAGLYLVKLTDVDTGQSFVQKLVVQ
ncbi:MAG: chitobiase/beta-hexosaminidase C-terminal domain-containing protein [Lentimicrobiaceae bacterium]|nr:chitobiase/beta-hexosaminidase C-terminal domain-containing protein [Lentimicrobiaceae bacterium]